MKKKNIYIYIFIFIYLYLYIYIYINNKKINNYIINKKSLLIIKI